MEERINEDNYLTKENIFNDKFEECMDKKNIEDKKVNKDVVITITHKDSDSSLLTQEQEAQLIAKINERDKRRASLLNCNPDVIKEIKRIKRHHATRNSIFSLPSPKRKSICSPGKKQWKTGSIMFNFMRKK